MSIIKGDCKNCGREDIEIFSDGGECIICRRLAKMEENIIAIEENITEIKNLDFLIKAINSNAVIKAAIKKIL